MYHYTLLKKRVDFNDVSQTTCKTCLEYVRFGDPDLNMPRGYSVTIKRDGRYLDYISPSARMFFFSSNLRS